MSRVPVAAVAATGLVVAFALAQGTGVRWLGGLVLLLTAAWCLRVAVPRVGWWRPVVVLVVGLALFVASHVAADVAGPWPAVLTAAAVLGATAWGLVDRARPRARRTGAGSVSGR
jgi:thiol:disulfide interchange protein